MNKLMTMRDDPCYAVLAANRLRFINAWQGRVRDPSLTALLVLELCAIFLAAPLAAEGLPLARAVADTLLLAVVVIVVTLSHRWGAVAFILLGVAAIVTSLILGEGLTPISVTLLRRGGDVLMFSALCWVVGHAVYAPGRITFHRLQGAVVLYLSIAMVFASAYGLILEMSPNAFANLLTRLDGPQEVAAMMYFSFTTLTTTGYGDVVAGDPFARSLANLEAIIGQFYLAITVARLVTLELGDRRS